jgi:hypothetical protein
LRLVFPRLTICAGGDCSLWLIASTWNDTIKAGVKQFALATMYATQDWFFWTWKVRRFLRSFH